MTKPSGQLPPGVGRSTLKSARGLECETEGMTRNVANGFLRSVGQTVRDSAKSLRRRVLKASWHFRIS